MNTKSGKPDPFDTLIDSYIEELIAMSDADVLDGADALTSQKEGLTLLDRAKAEAGRRRLTAARAKQAAQGSRREEADVEQVTAQEARAFLQQAANDGDYTLAARDLNDLSDHEALYLYQQFKSLQAQNDADPEKSE